MTRGIYSLKQEQVARVRREGIHVFWTCIACSHGRDMSHIIYSSQRTPPGITIG